MIGDNWDALHGPAVCNSWLRCRYLRRKTGRFQRLTHKYNAALRYSSLSSKGPSARSTKAASCRPPMETLDVKYLIRIAMTGLSLATITPVARGATLDAAAHTHLSAPAVLAH